MARIPDGYEDMQMNINFRDNEYNVLRTHYKPEHGARTAIVLWDMQHDEIGFVATVNLPEERLGANQTFIKDYSENEGMLKVLEAAGIVRDTGLRAQSGFVEIPIAEFQGRFREDNRAQEYNPGNDGISPPPKDRTWGR